jgi:hypothetical protein
MTREQVAQVNEEAIMLGNDDSFASAILGMTSGGCVAYDIDKLVACFMEINDWSEEDATEWVGFNCVGAHFGDYDPIYVQVQNEETE